MDSTSTNFKDDSRLYYLDWMRVLAFAILIIANAAEVFTQHGWWIKNSETYILLDQVLVFFRQWRMPLLFLISGAAITLVMKKRTITQFIDDRFVRILLPLMAGMILVIPAQIYFIWKSQGYAQGFVQFYLGIFDLKWFPQGNIHWLHLWYLAFIFIFSIVMLPALVYMRSEKVQNFLNEMARMISHPVFLFSSVLLIQIPYYIIESINPHGNLSSLVYYFPYFLFGALFLTRNFIRQTIVNQRKTALALGILCSALLYLFSWIINPQGKTILDLGFGDMVNQKILLLAVSLNQWFWVIAIIGFANRHLNFGAKALNYANKAVYPFYIMHQTIIVMIAYYVIPANISAASKFGLIIGGTIMLMILLYEFVLTRSTLSKVLFGIKTNIEITSTFPKSVFFVKRTFLSFLRVFVSKGT